jgi:low temperature requirement protein LtrA
VVFVNGDLNIDTEHNVDRGSYLMIIVNGEILLKIT